MGDMKAAPFIPFCILMDHCITIGQTDTRTDWHLFPRMDLKFSQYLFDSMYKDWPVLGALLSRIDLSDPTAPTKLSLSQKPPDKP